MVRFPDMYGSPMSRTPEAWRRRTPEQVANAAMATKLAAAAKQEAAASARVDELLREARETTTLTWLQIAKALRGRDWNEGDGEDERTKRRLISWARWRYYNHSIPIEESWRYLQDMKQGLPRKTPAPMPPGALTKKAAVEKLGVTRMTLDDWLRKGYVDKVEVGDRTFVQGVVGPDGSVTVTHRSPGRRKAQLGPAQP